jgi:hypothetical protein
MSVNILTKAGGHQGVTPIDVRAIYLASQAFKVTI